MWTVLGEGLDTSRFCFMPECIGITMETLLLLTCTKILNCSKYYILSVLSGNST